MKQLAIILVLLSMATLCHAESFRELSWDDLMPEGWMPPEWAEDYDPFAEHESSTAGSSDQESEAMISEPAPIVPALNKQKIKLPGYVIPLKFSEEAVTEFLLVPFVGACIHVPPPPENQMVYVKLKQPLESGDLWEPVWVMGTMSTQASQTEYATAGYRINDAVTKVYEY